MVLFLTHTAFVRSSSECSTCGHFVSHSRRMLSFYFERCAALPGTRPHIWWGRPQRLGLMCCSRLCCVWYHPHFRRSTGASIPGITCRVVGVLVVMDIQRIGCVHALVVMRLDF